MAEPQVFIGYRREDTLTFTERIHDWLVGRGLQVFQDADARIPPGTRFEPYILDLLRQCDVFLAVIGPQWLTLSRDGQRRLDHPEDWVRRELEVALGLPGIRVVPVLVDGAHMPTKAELPASIRELVDRQAQTIGHNPQFGGDMARLLDGLRAPVAAAATTRTIDCAGVPLELVWVPPGSFLMGATSTPGEPGYDALADSDEGPVRRVTLTRGFWLGRHPVTVAQYRAFCAATGHPRPEYDGESLEDLEPDDDALPVTRVDGFAGGPRPSQAPRARSSSELRRIGR